MTGLPPPFRLRLAGELFSEERRPAARSANHRGQLRGSAALAALDTALNALNAPAFVLDREGEILRTNVSGRILLDRDSEGVLRSLSRVIAGRTGALEWEVTPLRGTDKPRGFLAIQRSPRGESGVSDPLRTASERWRLTPRQTEVLRLTARGHTNASIAETLRIGQGTVEFHLAAIFDKAGVDNRARLIVKLLEP